MYLRLNRIQLPIYNLGPGKRIGLWVQGCSIKCNGCINPSLWSNEKGKLIDIESLVNGIYAIGGDYEGITISGGEPFEQYDALIAFCAFLKEKTSLSIFVFTGYYLIELEQKFSDKLFLKYIDYIMDGRFEKELHNDNNTRGSSNQKLYKIVEDSAVLQNNLFKGDRWSVSISNENQLFISGIPKKGELKRISSNLKKLGLQLEFE